MIMFSMVAYALLCAKPPKPPCQVSEIDDYCICMDQAKTVIEMSHVEDRWPEDEEELACSVDEQPFSVRKLTRHGFNFLYGVYWGSAARGMPVVDV